MYKERLELSQQFVVFVGISRTRMLLDELPHLYYIRLCLFDGIALMHSKVLHPPTPEEYGFGAGYLLMRS